MQSILFSKYGLLAENEDFLKDVNKLVDLPVGVLLDLAPLAFEYMNAPSPNEASKICDQASEKFAVPAWSMERTLDVSSFFLKQFTKFGKASLDQPTDIAADLETLVALEEEKKKGLIVFLEKLLELSKDRAEVAIARKRFARACLPMLESVEMVVDYRVVYDESFKGDDNINSYSPQVLGAMPLGIIKLEFSEDAPSDHSPSKPTKEPLRY